MSIELRNYQSDCVASVLKAKERGLNRVLYSLPTGTGKTFVFCALINESVGPVLLITHTTELMDQAEDTVEQFKAVGWLPKNLRVGREKAGEKAPIDSELIIASLQSLYRSERLSWLHPSLIIYDEGHHSPAKSSIKVLRRFGCFENNGPLLVGCTATPHRLDNKPLFGVENAIFQELVYNYSLLSASHDGFVCPCRAFRVRTTVNLDDVPILAGDFDRKKLSEKINVSARTESSLQAWKKFAKNRPTIIFCANIQHAQDTAILWREKGILTECISGVRKESERKDIVSKLKSGQIKVITTVAMLTEGFDFPPISCVVMLRPTKSWTFYSQMAGRGLRPARRKKDLIILDIVDNTRRHSLIAAPSLVGLPSSLDLQGHTLVEAHDKAEELRRLSITRFDETGSFGEMVIALEEIRLLGEHGKGNQSNKLNSVDNRQRYEVPETGTVFNKLRFLGDAIQRVPGGVYHGLWQCECGNPPRWYPISIVIRELIKSCGHCPRKSAAPSKISSVIPGFVQGNLTAVGERFRRKGVSYIKVRCACTREYEVTANALIGNRPTKSCISCAAKNWWREKRLKEKTV